MFSDDPSSASQSGNADIVGRLFDSGADGSIVNSRQHSSLHAAVHNSHESVVRRILDKFPEMVQVLESLKLVTCYVEYYYFVFLSNSKRPSNTGHHCMRPV